jgi:hypothetical protein
VTAAAQISTDKNELEANIQTAEETFKKIDSEFKAQLGKKFEDWPIDKKNEFLDAGYTVTYAQLQLILADSKKKHVDKIIEDVKKNFAGKGIMSRKKKFVEVVESREQADLIVEILGRFGGPGFLRGNKNICFNLVAGPNIDASVLGKIPREWPSSNYKDSCMRYHDYRPEEPFMQLMVSHSERWYDVADRISDVVDNLVKEYYALLKPDTVFPK